MITGGAGFIGSHLCDKFVDSNDQVIVLTRDSTSIDRISHLIGKIVLEKVDVTNHNELGKIIERHSPDVIIHLAGETSHSKSFDNPLSDVDSNSKSTLFILEKIRRLKLKCRFILGSTFIVVGKPRKLPVDEQSECNPTTIYGTNRLASEHFCKIYHAVYGLDTIIFRITNSFGPREQIIPNKNAVNHLIYKAYKGEEITIYNHGKLYRDLIYVSDVVSAITTILQKGESGELYWISSGKKLWFYDLGKILTGLTGAKVKYLPSPSYTKKVDVGNFVGDNSKLKKLGWKQKTSINEGIRQTIEYFQSLKL